METTATNEEVEKKNEIERQKELEKQKEIEKQIEEEKRKQAFGKKPKVKRSPIPTRGQPCGNVDTADKTRESIKTEGSSMKEQDDHALYLKERVEKTPKVVPGIGQTRTKMNDEENTDGRQNEGKDEEQEKTKATRTTKDLSLTKFVIPRSRALSLTDMEAADSPSTQFNDNRHHKRKRGENPLRAETQEDFGVVLMKVLNTISAEAMVLEQAVKGSYKLKTEIVNASSSICEELSKLNTDAFDEWIRKKGTQTEEELRIENMKLRRQVRNMEEANEENENLKNEITRLRAAQEVQCSDCEKMKNKLKRRSLKAEESFINFQQFNEDDWSDEIFPRVTVVNGPIWEAPFEEQLVLPCSKNFATDNKLVGNAIKRCGGQDGLIKQNRTKGEVAKMTYSLGFPEPDGNIFQNTRCIYYPIVDDGGVWEKVEDEILFKALQRLKEQILNDKNWIVAIPEMGGISGTIYKRMIEYLFVDTGIEVKMYVTGKDYAKQTAAASRNKDSRKPQQNTAPEEKKKKNDAILVQMKGKSYADLLKVVKEAVDPDELGVDIKDVSKTKRGELLLKVGNGPGKAQELKQIMKQKIPEATTSLLLNRRVLHIKGMDEVTTEEEIKVAICKVISAEENDFKLSALRPAYGGRRNVTVIMTGKDADKLLKMDTIKIGWTLCRIRERKEVTRCYKCWEYGHIKSQCKGPDREALCLKCAKPGHKASECSNKAHCVICEQDGHQTGSPRCTTQNV